MSYDISDPTSYRINQQVYIVLYQYPVELVATRIVRIEYRPVNVHGTEIMVPLFYLDLPGEMGKIAVQSNRFDKEYGIAYAEYLVKRKEWLAKTP